MALPVSMQSGVDQLMRLSGRENMPSDMQQRLQDAEEKEASALRDISQGELLQQRLGKTRAGLLEKIGTREKEIGEEQATKYKNIVEDPDHATKVAYFTPTKTTGSELMGLFSMLTAVAFMSGGKGRYAGNAAMNNLAGALEGWNKGRQDLFKQEVLEFDKNSKALQEHNRSVEQKLKRALDLWQVNRDAAMGEIAQLKGEEAGSALQQELNKGNLDRAYKMVTEARQAADKTIDQWEKIVGKVFELEKQAQRDAAADARQQRTFEQQFKLLEEKLAHGKGMEPDATTRKSYVADAVLSNDIRELAGMLEQSPTLRQKVSSDRLRAYLSEKDTTLSQVTQSETDPEVRRFLQRIADMRNNYYLDISGKAVTASEALRSYNAVPQPGDTPEAMIDKLRGMERRVDQKIGLYRQMYPSLPKLDASQFNSSTTGSQLTPQDTSTTSAQPSATTIQPGEVRKGYRFKGGNPADKNNWEKVSG